MNGFSLRIKSGTEHTNKMWEGLKRKTLKKLISEDQPWLTVKTVTQSPQKSEIRDIYLQAEPQLVNKI